MDPLKCAQRIQTLGQAGLTYSKNPFDRERYRELLTIAAELASSSVGGTPAELAHIFALESGYPTPKVDVRAVVQNEDKLLFVREVTDGFWALPGGWADPGESAAEVASREVREEAGYRVRPTRLLAVYDKAKHEHPKSYWHTYKMFFLCELLVGEPAPSHETSEVAFFGAHELPPLSIPRVTRAQVLRMLELVRRPDLPADFD